MIPQRCAAKTSYDYNRIHSDDPAFDGRCRRTATVSIDHRLYCREHASLIALDQAIAARTAQILPNGGKLMIAPTHAPQAEQKERG